MDTDDERPPAELRPAAFEIAYRAARTGGSRAPHCAGSRSTVSRAL